MSEKQAIYTQQLKKSYGAVQALRGVDLEVEEGQVFGVLGPNGAGKTTTIRCLLDLIRPDSGVVRVLGMNPQANPQEVRARTGYLPGELHLDGNMRGEAALRFFNSLRGGTTPWAVIQQLANRLELDLKRPIKNLSHGNKVKIGIIQALMHQPQLLVLDEPTTGLDPLMQREVLRLVKEAQASGATVFFSSHQISEVETIASHVAIIRQGVVVEVVEIAELLSRALRRVRVRFRHPVDPHPLLQLQGVSMLRQENDTELHVQVIGDMDAFLKALANLPVVEMDTERPSLEEIFMAYYNPEQREGR